MCGGGGGGGGGGVELRTPCSFLNCMLCAPVTVHVLCLANKMYNVYSEPSVIRPSIIQHLDYPAWEINDIHYFLVHIN